MVAMEKEKELLGARIEKLKQEVKDGFDSKKLHEKKGASMVNKKIYLLSPPVHHARGLICITFCL